MIRTRFAPSPTGQMHIGNLRTALYAYLIAKHEGGTFILRIEDTDRSRNQPEALQGIYRGLALAGLEHDEGPNKGGDYGPYVQSERLPIYQEHGQRLVESGNAYYCFCAKTEKTDDDEEASYTEVTRDPCRDLSPEAVAEKFSQGIVPVIRQRIPESGSTTYDDLILGSITFENNQLDDQILLKSDGFPTYNFANVVDDHLMAITHVVRGQEYLSSAPKYSLLYEAFGWQPPAYAHMPLIVKEDGSKFSKRAGDPGFEDLVRMGYLPSAILNYVALLGWNPGTDQEIFYLEDLVKVFDFHRINVSPAKFSFDKLNWMNGEHIRLLSPEAFHALALPYYPESLRNLDLERVSALIQLRTEKLTDIPAMVAFLAELPAYELDLFESQKSKSSLESSRKVLADTLSLLENMTEWSNTALFEQLKAYAQESGQKVGTVMWPIRTAVSGLAFTPGGATELAEILGKDETLKRVHLALSRLES